MTRLIVGMTGNAIHIRNQVSERGGVLVTVLIIAAVFAVLAYITLQVSIHSLESADTHAGMFQARVVAEGGIQSAAASLRQGEFGADQDNAPAFIDPSYALSVTEDELRSYLIDINNTTEREISEFPLAYERTGYTVDTGVTLSTADTEVIAGDRDVASYRYQDDYIFSEDYPAYEFAPVKSTGDLVVYGVGEVLDREGDQTIFSFLRAQFPNTEWNYDVRETGVTEPSRLGPYPYIETEHPYLPNQSRNWLVTYQEDPAHPGRHIENIQLLASDGEVEIDAGDKLWVTYWNENAGQFVNPPIEELDNYQQVGDGPFHGLFVDPDPELDITTIGLYFLSDPFSLSVGGMDFGFKVDGVRYHFDEDESQAYYETPHPYEEIVPLYDATTGDLNIQTIYSHYQPPTGTAEWFGQRMRIQFDLNFSLDGTDQLLIFNAADESPVAPIAMWSQATPPPLDGYAPEIGHPMLGNPDLPLGYIMVLVRNTGIDSDGIPDYGYKVAGMEYTDQFGNWLRVDDPVIESPHSINLGANNPAFTFPAIGLPLPLPAPGNYVGYQTLYKPFCPNAEAVDGVGTVDNWFVTFADAALTAASGAANGDYIRITTPGHTLIIDDRPAVPVPYDTLFFVHRNGALGGNIFDPIDPTTSAQYWDIDDLPEWLFNFDTADVLQMEFLSDTTDAYYAPLENFGYRLGQVVYTTTDGADDDWTPPTIRTDVSFPTNDRYPSFGTSLWSRAEWWYTNNDPSPQPLLVGLHFDRYHFNLDPGDVIEIYDENGILIATLSSASVSGGPDAGGPENPSGPTGGEQEGQGPHVGGPNPGESTYTNLVDLNETFGWVLVPGKTAQVILYGDGDDNEGFAGFEINHCAYINGEITEIRDYVTDYTELAYDQYYDRSSSALDAFRTLGYN